MSDELGKYKRIVDREEEEFKRAIEEDVSTLFSSKFSNEYKILDGVHIISHSQVDLPIFK